jgi:hypothetical protein
MAEDHTTGDNFSKRMPTALTSGSDDECEGYPTVRLHKTAGDLRDLRRALKKQRDTALEVVNYLAQKTAILEAVNIKLDSIWSHAYDEFLRIAMRANADLNVLTTK